MPRYTYERLSAQDNSFLMAERPNVHMHVAATQIFETGPLATSGGGIDYAAFKGAINSVLHLIPRYRQRLKWIPFENHPVWVDDRVFSLDYHVRHTALPKPGSDEQLKHLAARIMAQQLDRARPLWEIWLVEGLRGGRFAVITKVHHCMMDGESGADLAYTLLSPNPDYEPSDPATYIPRPSPTTWELFLDSLANRLAMPIQAVRDFRRFSRETADTGAEVWSRVKAMGEIVGWAMRPSSDTPFNGRLGPHRRFDWLTMPLRHVKQVSKRAECTVNDVVLASVTGAVRDFLIRRRVDPGTIDFRLSAPVSVRREKDRGRMGNHVSSWIVKLPIHETDPLRRLAALHEVTNELKRSRQALGVEMMMTVAEWTPSVLLSLGAQAASGPINMIVTNVPGPQFPLYSLGARLLEVYPQVPLLQNTGVGVALFSYDGKLCWGFNADYELMPDLRSFVRGIDRAFTALAGATGVQLTDAPAPAGKVPSEPVVELHPPDSVSH
jgi:WS/DGAT/MGAT family acyltransferase